MENLRHKKSLGQNFLVDKNIAKKIVDTAEIEPGDKVIEIGPGTGALTEFLVEKTDNLTCIEIDKRAVEILQKKFPKLNIISQDFLKVNFNEIADKNSKIKIIGNLPYYISSQIIFKILENSELFSSFTFMIQKEVAERIVSPPNSKDYGILTLAIEMCGTAKKQFNVPPNVFKPAPEVTSTVVRIDFNANDFNKDLLRFIKAGFGKRRKKLSNSIQSYFPDKDVYKSIKDSPEFPEKLKEMLNLRAENLTLQDFKELYIYFQEKLSD